MLKLFKLCKKHKSNQKKKSFVKHYFKYYDVSLKHLNNFLTQNSYVRESNHICLNENLSVDNLIILFTMLPHTMY